jgi:4-hydroxybenzoate polyprenyltransferase
LRLPNLFTVPGDPLAGFLLATGGVLDWRVAGAIAVSLLLYSAGLLLNDYFDREVDARERPERPIPSGGVSEVLVVWVGFDLLIAGVVVGILRGGWQGAVVAPALALAVVAYNAGLKKLRWVGPIVMGSCRAGSVVVGAAFAGSAAAPAVLVCSGVMGIYITAVTFLAAREMGPTRPGLGAFAPSVVLVGGWVAMAPFFSRRGGPMVLAMGFLTVALIEVLAAARNVRRGRIAVPQFIGRLIRVMMMVQAAWCLCTITRETWVAGLGAAGSLVILRGGAEVASRCFYGS